MSTKKDETGKRNKRALVDLEFGRRLKEAFNFAKNKDIAAQTQISDGSISKYINGRVPDPPELIKLANVSGRSIHWLLTGEGPEKAEDLVAATGKADLEMERRKAVRAYVVGLMVELDEGEEREVKKKTG